MPNWSDSEGRIQFQPETLHTFLLPQPPFMWCSDYHGNPINTMATGTGRREERREGEIINKCFETHWGWGGGGVEEEMRGRGGWTTSLGLESWGLVDKENNMFLFKGGHSKGGKQANN